MDAEQVLVGLRRAGATLATAESLTGGRLAALVTAVPGASQVYRGGVVTYATELKVELLGVPETLVAEHGVVSAECARAMAEGARLALGATYAVSTTGVAGPDQQDGRPVGTVFVGVAGPARTTVSALQLTGDRATIQDRTCHAALDALAAVAAPPGPRAGDSLGEEPRLG